MTICTKSIKRVLGIGPTAAQEQAKADQKAATLAAIYGPATTPTPTVVAAPEPPAPTAAPIVSATPQMADVSTTTEEDEKKKLAKAMLKGRSALRIDRVGKGGGSTAGIQMPM